MKKDDREFVEDFKRGIQTYQHKVEVVIRGMGGLIQALNNLNEFLIEQQGSEWNDLDGLVRSALKEMKMSRRWIVKALPPKLKRGRQRK